MQAPSLQLHKKLYTLPTLFYTEPNSTSNDCWSKAKSANAEYTKHCWLTQRKKLGMSEQLTLQLM